MRQYSALERLRIAARLASAWPSLRHFSQRPRQSMERWQVERLKEVFTHAYHNNRFYRRKFVSAGVRPSDIVSLKAFSELVPLTTKQEIIDNIELVVPKRSRSGSIVSRTSGSSGAFFDIYHKPDETAAYILGLYRIFAEATDYRPWTKAAYIYTSPYPARSLFGLYPSKFIPTLNELENTKRQLLEYRPRIISAYPSHLLELGKLLSNQESAKLGCKAVIVGSECSTPQMRDRIAKQFRCAVYEEYSSEELGWIASSCGKHMHIIEDMNYIEIIDAHTGEPATPGTSGEVIGTHFWNSLMPFIRYRQGDVASIPQVQCSCRQQSRILSQLQGRTNDSFIIAGERKSSGFLLDLIYTASLAGWLDVIDFELRQAKAIELRVIPSASFTKEKESKLRQFFEERLNAPIKILRVRELPRTASGKRKRIVSYAKA